MYRWVGTIFSKLASRVCDTSPRASRNTAKRSDPAVKTDLETDPGAVEPDSGAVEPDSGAVEPNSGAVESHQG
ncbi:hypothetical protein DCS_08219 [Drechmeria coniospora]|uniref:Uncharacterized protein n=1 Tax=Drechmeria coniospora TaxID=98403 RepID=A0A151GGM6_DRECN|nr:hypothetical protein DCS_08219 [Drechmeria coniospora]KYK56249.1 hypothetical protein DCS_08219 [Drechmeria coniospora]